MSFSLFSVVIILIFFTIAAIEVYRGFFRGFTKSLLSLGSLVISVLLSVSFSPALSRLIVHPIFNRFVRTMKAYKNLIKKYESFDPFIEAAVCAVISTLVFVLLFFILRGIIGAIVSLISRKYLPKKVDDPCYLQEKGSFVLRHNKLLGAIIGGVSAMIITMVVTSPLMGALNIAGDVMDAAERADSKIWSKAKIKEEEIENFKTVATDLPGNLFYELGGKYMYHSVACTEIYGQKAYLLNEIDTVEVILDDFLNVYEILKKPQDVKDHHIKHIESLRDQVNELQLCHGVLAEYLSDGTNAWLNGKKIFKISKPSMHPAFDPVFDQVLTACSESNENNVKQNMTTLLNMYIIILESDMTGMKKMNYTQLMTYLEETNLIEKLDAELDKNPYMANISVAAMAMKLLCQKIEAVSYTQEEYSTLMGNLAEAINTVQNRGYGSTEEKVAVLTSYAQEYIDDFGFDISPTIAQSAATELLSSLKLDGSEITAEDIEKIFKQFLE